MPGGSRTPSRLSGSYATGSPYVRSRSGPSISRLSSDRTRESTSSGPSSRTRTTSAPETGRGTSSRAIDRQAILERYGNRFPRAESTGNSGRTSDGQGPSTARTSRSRTTESGPTGGRDRTTGTRTAGGERTSRSGPSSRTTAGRTADGDRTSRSARGSDRERGSGGDDNRKAQDRSRALRDLTSVNPRRADEITRVGERVSDATRTALSVGIGISLGYYGSYYPYCNGWGYWNNGYYYGAGYSYYWACGGYSYSPYCHPYSWPYYWWYGCYPRNIGTWYSGGFYTPGYYAAPIYYANAITTYVSEPYYEEPVQETVYVEEAPVGEAVAQSTSTESMPAPTSTALDPNARASGQYLTLGDQAFRDGRFADAVHFYARAVEYAPDEGILYLVLSDGLFATGDYHYGAYALKRALELDPVLAQSDVDKHTFYTDPIEFEQQLAVLERFLKDHPTDDDARLMLAANYLFGGRPAAAVDLLQDPAASAVIGAPAGALLLAAARAQQYGR